MAESRHVAAERRHRLTAALGLAAQLFAAPAALAQQQGAAAGGADGFRPPARVEVALIRSATLSGQDILRGDASA